MTGEPMPAARARAGRAMTAGGEANAERILDAALAVFARRGLTGGRIDDIARAAGLSKPNLLYYFRSKHDLYLAVLTRTLDRWLEPLRDLDETAEPRAALAAWITAKLEQARDRPDESRLFALEIIQGAPVLGPVLSGALKALVDRKAEVLRRWMERGLVPRADPRQVIFLVWATTQHYADFAAQVSAVAGRDLSDPAFLAEARALILRAVAGEGPALPPGASAVYNA